MHSRRPPETALRRILTARSRAMQNVAATVAKLVDRDVSILVTGESGSGKNHLAAAIHASGARSAAPFTHIDCAAIPHDLFESELFGYEKGTFTDATARKSGKLESAREGTLYLDEIAALEPALQAKLLRAIEERRFSRLGGSEEISFRARIIASTSADLDALVAGGGMRRDFLYRVNVVTVVPPPLRDRREDILPLATAFLATTAPELSGFDEEAKTLLAAYSWPGNVRELRNVIERAAAIETSGVVTAASLPAEQFRSAPALLGAASRGEWTLDDLERRYIAEVLRITKSNYSKAAEILGINRKTLLEKRRRYGME